MMVVLMPLTLARLQTTDHRSKLLKKIGWAIVCILFALVLIYTKSRSGILGAGLALGLQVGLSVLFALKQRPPKKPVVSSLSSVVFLIVFAVLVISIANPVRDKLEQLIHLPSLSKTTAVTTAPTVGTQLDTGGSESGDIRKIVWSGALKVWVRYPIFGSGVETFAYSYYKDRPREHNMLSEWDFLYNKAHNEFLNYLATTGAFGLIAYVLMYGSIIVLPIIWAFQKDTSQAVRYQLFAVSSALAGLAVSNFFGFSTVVVSMYTFALPAFAVVMSERGHILTIPLTLLLRKKIIGQILLVATLVSCLSSLISVYRMYSVDVDYAASKSMIAHQDVETGVALLQSVVDSAPDEPVYRDELAYTAARLSYALGSTGDSTSAAKFAQAAIDNSDEVLTQNHANVNFYKTRARIFTLLGQLSPVFYKQAIDTLTHARDLSPTDPKLTYSMAIVANAQGDKVAYEQALRETLSLRPIDIQARIDLARLYEDEKRTDDAKREYAEVLKLDASNKEVKDRIASLSATPKKK
jgi:tetratricopeptide (TPR) repeat protein